MQKSKFRNQKYPANGFTLIELLVSAVLITMLGGALVGLQFAFKQNQVSVWQNYENVNQANRIISTMEKELRNIHESGNGSYPLVTASDQEVIFYCDYDYDGDIERIRYSKSSTQIIKGVIEPVGIPATYPLANEKAVIIAENIRNGTDPLFYYYNGDWPNDTTNNPLALADRIADTKMVRIVIRINIKVDTKSDYVLDSSVLLRSLKES